ncbi:unnamed protein product, partial [Staurois parvus]
QVSGPQAERRAPDPQAERTGLGPPGGAAGARPPGGATGLGPPGGAAAPDPQAERRAPRAPRRSGGSPGPQAEWRWAPDPQAERRAPSRAPTGGRRVNRHDPRRRIAGRTAGTPRRVIWLGGAPRHQARSGLRVNWHDRWHWVRHWIVWLD